MSFSYRACSYSLEAIVRQNSAIYCILSTGKRQLCEDFTEGLHEGMEIIYCPPNSKQFNKTPCGSQVSPLLPFWPICVLRTSMGYFRATALKLPLLSPFPRRSHGSLPPPLGLCSNPTISGRPSHSTPSLFPI